MALGNRFVAPKFDAIAQRFKGDAIHFVGPFAFARFVGDWFSGSIVISARLDAALNQSL